VPHSPRNVDHSACAAKKTTQTGGAANLPCRETCHWSAAGDLDRKVKAQSMNAEQRKRSREVPLVLLGGIDPAALRRLARVMHQEGMGVAGALGDRACLRVAAALSPDIILLDPRLPRALLNLLRAHPLSKSAHISWSQALAHPAARLCPKAQPHRVPSSRSTVGMTWRPWHAP
jgi:hypothetical protein